MVMPVTVDVIVTVAANALLWSVVERAVTATVLPDGTPLGAVNVAADPLAVCAGEKDPQFGPLAHIATQSTPAFAISLFTAAETDALVLVGIVAGGACVMETEISGVAVPLARELLEQPVVHKRTYITAARLTSVQ